MVTSLYHKRVPNNSLRGKATVDWESVRLCDSLAPCYSPYFLGFFIVNYSSPLVVFYSSR